jgi:arabinose operon protein AraL
VKSRARRPAVYAGYALDLDGTVYLGDTLLPGAMETIQALRARGSRVVFLSNNPLRSCAAYAARLSALGVPAEPADVLNSSAVMAAYLARRCPGARLFVIGERSLCDELAAAGFTMVEDPAQVDLVVASFDRSFEYRKLAIAFDAIRGGAGFVATNRDPYCPVPGGGLPDCGAIVAAIEACTGTAVEEVVGKPSRIMARAVLRRLGLPAQATLMVGDRLDTDVAMGARAGMVTALVLTGAARRADLRRAAVRPDFVLDDLRGLLPEGRVEARVS